MQTAVKEHPILFSTPMVRAILEGTKTQTRRVIRPQPEHVWGWGVKFDEHDFTAHVRYHGGHPPDPWVRCPYGAPPHRGHPGDRLWVRETWVNNFGVLLYRADCHPDSFEYGAKGWKPSIHMPRWASRITLEIAGIRVERLQDISEADICAELGCPLEWPGPGLEPYKRDLRSGFAGLWNSINEKRGYPWSSNPWVWVIEFRT